MKASFPRLILTFPVLLLFGCSSLVYEGADDGPLSSDGGLVLLIPFENATNNGSAGIALSEMTASALTAAGIPWISQSDEGVVSNASFILEGNVHEFEYKTDLNGDPVAGASATLRDAKSGDPVWQGSASATGFGVSSLSEAGQKVADRLVSRMVGGSSFGF